MSEQSHASPSHIGLIVSLCVNLLLAGVIAMGAFRFFVHEPDGRHAHPQMSASLIERFQVRQMLSPRTMARVAPEKGDKIGEVLRAHHDKIDQLKKASMEARREVLRLYLAPVLDRTALEKALAAMQAADFAVETEVMKTSAEMAALLSPEERKNAADWRSRMRHFGNGMGGMAWRPDQPPGGEAPRGEPNGPRPE